MKFFQLLCIALFFTSSLAAQYEKGNWYLDANSAASLSIPIGEPRLGVPFEVQSLQAGYFITNRLLVGSRIIMIGDLPNNGSLGSLDIVLSPFARYYFPGGDKRKVSFFGEAGLGTITPFSGNGFFETDFHFGGGAEVELLPGVVGTAMLRYNANATGLNITSLTFGLNLLLGQLEKLENEAPIRAGTFTTTGSFGGLSFGNHGFNAQSDLVGSAYLSPNLGFFLRDGLMAEGTFSLSYSGLKDVLDFGQGNTESRNINILSTSLEFNLRYYLRKSGALLPYVTGGLGYEIYQARVTGGTFDDRDFKRNTFFYQTGIGMSWFLAKNIALDGAVRYRSDRFGAIDGFNNTVRQNVIQTKVGLRFFLKR